MAGRVLIKGSASERQSFTRKHRVAPMGAANRRTFGHASRLGVGMNAKS